MFKETQKTVWDLGYFDGSLALQSLEEKKQT